MNPFAKETLPISLEEEMRRSYLDYAMSVIVGRALPDARDGLHRGEPATRPCATRAPEARGAARAPTSARPRRAG